MKIGLDLDGTLISCQQKHCTLMAVLCKAYGVSMDLDHWWQLKREGHNGKAALKRIGTPDDLSNKLLAAWEHQIESWPWLDFDRAFPETTTLLNQWIESGHQLHLISARNNIKAATQQLVRLFPTAPFCSVTFIPRNSATTKSDVIRQQRVDLYIGDTEQDDQAARHTHVPSYLVSTGMRCTNFLHANTGGQVIGYLSNLPRSLL